MNNLEYQWQQAFVKVLTEVDQEMFPKRLLVADDAVFNRLFDLEGTVGTEGERVALEETMQDLLLLRNQSYNFRVG